MATIIVTLKNRFESRLIDMSTLKWLKNYSQVSPACAAAKLVEYKWPATLRLPALLININRLPYCCVDVTTFATPGFESKYLVIVTSKTLAAPASPIVDMVSHVDGT